MALAHELDLSDNQPSPAYHVACSRYFMAKREFENAISSATVAIKEETEVYTAQMWSTRAKLSIHFQVLRPVTPLFVLIAAVVTMDLCSAVCV